ncbi:MAG: polyprenyl synthetase family protein [Candidatus Paceibacterota bacterium]
MKKRQLFNLMKNTAEDIDKYLIEKLEELEKEDRLLHESVSRLVSLRRNKPKLRATLGRLIYEYCGGKNWHDILPLLGFMELSTISTYVLDDIIDSQPEREGKIATHEEFGLNYGIIAGSLQAFISIKLLSDLKIKDCSKLKILTLANQMWEILWVGEGINEDMKDDTTAAKYIERCYKICGVMFETMAKTSAIAADSSDREVEQFGEIGRVFGTGVMARNDLTCFLPEEIMRKNSKALSRISFEDVRKGIWTYPIICAMEKEESDKAQIRKLLGNKKASGEELLDLTKTLIRLGCIDETLDLITSYKLKGLDRVDRLNESDPKAYLVELFELLENTREYVKEL